jgi:DNA processing protein
MEKTIKGRDIIAFLAIKYHNNWTNIYMAIKNKELVDQTIIYETLSKVKGDYVCIIDSNYPDSLKKVIMPPFVVFLNKADRKTIKDEYSDSFLDHFETADAVIGA